MKAWNSIESSWMNSLKKGQQPSHANLREHLMLVHRDHAGFAESCALRCLDVLGRNSYEQLSSVVDPLKHSNVMDLACGSGVLLEICRQRCGGACSVTGVDMSEEELALARQRNPDPAVRLYLGVAQDLSFIDDAEFDVVLCHWALTLMDQVPVVMREVKRLLRPRGIFAAIVDGEPESAPYYSEIHNLIYHFVRLEHPKYGQTDLGDPLVRDGHSLEQLAIDSFNGASITIEPLVFDLCASPNILAREAAGFFYASFVLSGSAHKQMLQELEALFTRQGKGEKSRFSLPVNKLVIRQ